MKALTRDIIKNVIDEFPFVKSIQESRESPQIQARSADAQQMILNTTEFGHNRANHFATRRQIDVKECLDCCVPRNIVANWRCIIHSTDRANILVVIMMLAKFFKSRMQISDVRRRARDALAIQLEHQSQCGVCCGMLRTEVENPTIG